ncbi:hypothetical protein CMV_012410 [Castanea mollissima]|uniref:Uncharacterized protein n=1 Tax=Castanea mollissima TaxID=60419 RepID=A0A8J4RI73_9ROSI|nr:hypothetical protein CMV_012410 [Castanea mollissima]
MSSALHALFMWECDGSDTSCISEVLKTVVIYTEQACSGATKRMKADHGWMRLLQISVPTKMRNARQSGCAKKPNGLARKVLTILPVNETSHEDELNLIAEFDLELHVSEDCSSCYGKEGKDSYTRSRRLNVTVIATFFAGTGILMVIIYCSWRKLSSIKEMVGGRKNIDVSVDLTSEIYFPHWIYKRLELNEELGLLGLLKEGDEDTARKMIIVSLWCIQTNPSNRPLMSKVVDMLEGSLESLQIPPKPCLSSPPRSPIDSSTIMMSIQYDSTH